MSEDGTIYRKKENTASNYVQSTTIFQECVNTIPSLQYSMQIVWWKDMMKENDGNESEENI
jgi:hypothetical protein